MECRLRSVRVQAVVSAIDLRMIAAWYAATILSCMESTCGPVAYLGAGWVGSTDVSQYLALSTQKESSDIPKQHM